MHLTVNAQRFTQDLRRLNKIVPQKSTLPIYSHVLLEAKGEELHLTGSQMELAFHTVCHANIHEPGRVTLPARKLLELVEQCPDGDVEIATELSMVYVNCGSFRSRLQTLSAEFYPHIPQVAPTAVEATFPAGVLQRMMTNVRYAIADNANKYMISGALLTQHEDTVAMIATDGKRLSFKAWTQTDGTMIDPAVVIPTKTLDALLNLLPSDALSLTQTDRHLFFAGSNGVLISRMLESKFPEYRQIIPKDNTRTVTFNPQTVLAALKRVGSVSDDTRSITLTFKATELLIATRSVEVGDAIESLPISCSGDDCLVRIDGTYLVDFLKGCQAPVTLRFKDEKTPLLLEEEGTNFLNVIILMRR